MIFSHSKSAASRAPRHATTKAASPTARLLLAILCVALVLFGATLQAVHTHADDSLTHADCSLCATAHVVTQVAAQPAPNQVAFLIAQVNVAPALIPMSELHHFALFTRPPPVPMHLA
ncbi:MAG: hypothetical protein HIU93_12420 [Acidobacteria bacterium]|nr:hypothetical protein [Acidobacteriota bacterium]